MRPPQRRQRSELVKHAGADRVVDDIDAVARTGQLLDLVAEPAAVVDREIGALLEAGGALLVGAGGRDDGRAEQFRDLDGGDADAAGGAVDQHPIARLQQSAALQQRVVGGVMRAAEHGGLLDAHPVRHGVAIIGAGISELREGAEPVAAHDAVAEPEAGDAVADRDDFAGPLVARDKRRFRAGNWYFPASIRTSTYCTPRAWIRTCTSPGPGEAGSGSSRSASTSGPPNASQTTALMRHALAVQGRHRIGRCYRSETARRNAAGLSWRQVRECRGGGVAASKEGRDERSGDHWRSRLSA